MNILVIAPHPDDETLGCGGTLLKHKEKGDVLFWLIITKMSPEVGYSNEQISVRAQEIDMVSKTYQFKNVFSLDFATTTLDTIAMRTIINGVSSVIAEVKPEVVYLPNQNDVHSDHRVTFDAVFGAIKTFRMPSVMRILSYEVVSETEYAPPSQAHAFVPNSFYDISNFLDKKIEIMHSYRSELGKHPFPRSEENIRALATLRGATAGVRYAEAFMLLKEIL